MGHGVGPGSLVVPVESQLQKEAEVFYYPDPRGLVPEEPGGFGLYVLDTRYLSCWELRLGNQRLACQGSLLVTGEGALEVETLVTAGCLFARLRIRSAARRDRLSMTFAADFRDVFEVRGICAPLARPPVSVRLGPKGCTFRCPGRDGVIRRTEIRWAPPPDAWYAEGVRAVASYRAEPGRVVEIAVIPGIEGQRSTALPSSGWTFEAARAERRRREESWNRACTQIRCSHEGFAALFARARRDLGDLWSGGSREGVLHAGAPWFVAPFGRDALIAAWEALLLNPSLAPATLRYLARWQGRTTDLLTEEAPGKILHELRRGELARAHLVPHGPYYGSVDATPLWAAILGATCRWTRDPSLLRELEPHLTAALAWCSGPGDLDGDGFIEYRGRRSPWGLVHEGWKDSWDGIVDAEGHVPEGPIALVEVQGYHYRALVEAAEMYRAIDRPAEAAAARRSAIALARRIAGSFLTAPFPPVALDGQKRPVASLTSNPGHLLATGPLTPEQAVRIARRLLAPDFFSGWGIRTLAASEPAYNPLSYHNGSVWPHDTALIAFGLRRRGLVEEACQVGEAMLTALASFPGGKIPELFSGEPRSPGQPPNPYPGACTLQAWSAASVFLLLRTLLGLSVTERGLRVVQPRLPQGVEELVLERLRVGHGQVSLRFTPLGCEILDVDGPVEVAVLASRQAPSPQIS